MAKFIPIEYHNKAYPFGIACNMQEITANFDIEKVETSVKYSLYTDHSFASRRWDGGQLSGLDALKAAHRKCVPQLWKSRQWAEEFAEFIFRITPPSNPPAVVEIHPPYNDYCPDMETFLQSYLIFEEIVLKKFPDTEILLENRCGTFYTGGRFLVCRAREILTFLKSLDCTKRLGLMLDYPQLFSIEFHDMPHLKIETVEEINRAFTPYRGRIRGVHLWGKKQTQKGRWISHHGNFNTLFCGNYQNKSRFLQSLNALFDDEVPRYLVPEVNSDEYDLKSIVRDLLDWKFEFV